MPDGTHLLGPHKVAPSAEDEQILAAIRNNRPEDIDGLLWTKPDFSAEGHKIVRTFAVEGKKRGDLGYIRCAICSSDHPKFLEGAVLWSPDCWLRLIGHVCAAKPEHFGEVRYRDLRKQRQQEELDSLTFDWMAANGSAINPLIANIQGLKAFAEFFEAQQKVFFRDVAPLAMQLENAARHYGGVLSVTQELAGSRLVAAVLAESSVARAAQVEFETVNLGTMAGQSFLLRPSIKRSRHLTTIAEAFQRVPPGEGDEPMLALIDRGGQHEITVTAGLVFRQMQRAVKLAEECADAERFLTSENLTVLESWGQDVRNPMKFTLRRYGSRVAFLLPDRSQATIQTIWPKLPDLSRLRAIVGAGIELDSALTRHGR